MTTSVTVAVPKDAHHINHIKVFAVDAASGDQNPFETTTLIGRVDRGERQEFHATTSRQILIREIGA